MASETIQRVLYIAPRVHIYQIPPQSSNKGHTAAQWTSPPSRQIFTARLRLVETSNTDDTNISASILLEDPSSGELFAAAPYTTAGVVVQAIDSSRFFAVRVVGDGGMKAVLGMGFEDRSEAFDFGVALQDLKRGLGWEDAATESRGTKQGSVVAAPAKTEAKKDWSLKEGEMLKVDLGGLGKKKDVGEKGSGGPETSSVATSKNAAGGFAFLPPPPSYSSDSRTERRRSREVPPSAFVDPDVDGQKPEDLGFDDGEFGEFA
jgi:hypothetical protein